MERLLIECLVRGTLIAAATAIVLRVARIRTPALLHAAWASVVVAMLLLPAWTLWGFRASIPMLPQQEAGARAIPSPAVAIGAARTPRAEGIRSQRDPRIDPRNDVWNRQRVFVTVYGVIAGALLVRLVVGTVRVRRVVRLSVLRAGRLTNTGCASPLTVGWLHPVVILPQGWEEWSRSKLDAVLVHEQEHARRRDPLVQWVALLNRALFWFHPLAWWLERRLAALAEQVCDDAVLGQGHEPQAYSEYLIEIAHAAARGTRVNLAGAFMPGGFLPQRIRRIVAGVSTPSVSHARMACAAAACAVASALAVVATPVRAASQLPDGPSRVVIRPIQPRWISPDAALPQPVSLDWLDGDEWTFQVQPIITNEELAAYSRLETPRQRDAFIARFWADRDPTPGTLENELQSEYTRRVQYGIDHFGASGQAGFGFDTDRGRIYLMFGSPDAIETDRAGGDTAEIWRYAAASGLGADLRFRFSLERGGYCGHRILSPLPVKTIEAAASVNEPRSHASVQIYPHGLIGISVPLDAEKVAGARYELHNSQGIEVDKGQIGSVEEGAGGPLAQHLPSSWLTTGLGCTHALPPGTYTLSAAVRFVNGRVQREQVTFELQ